MDDGRSISYHEAATLQLRSQALQVMRCLLDICPSQGRTAVVQRGTASAAIHRWAMYLPSRFSDTHRNLSRTFRNSLSLWHVWVQTVLWLLQDITLQRQTEVKQPLRRSSKMTVPGIQSFYVGFIFILWWGSWCYYPFFAIIFHLLCYVFKYWQKH